MTPEHLEHLRQLSLLPCLSRVEVRRLLVRRLSLTEYEQVGQFLHTQLPNGWWDEVDHQEILDARGPGTDG